MRERRERVCDFEFVAEKDAPAAVFGEDERLIKIVQLRRVALEDRLDQRVNRKQKNQISVETRDCAEIAK